MSADSRKVKVSVTISGDLLTKIDREASRSKGQTRSSVMETWLRHGARQQAEKELESATIAYYDRVDQDSDDETLGRALSAAARSVDVGARGAAKTKKAKKK